MKNKRIESLEKAATPKKFPDGAAYRSISMASTNQLALELGVSAREIDISALDRDIVPERYARNMKSFTTRDQKTLLESCVTVVGTGGLGGTVAETLARIGVGMLILIDGDSFEESNLNRQFLSTQDSIAESKADAAIKRVQEINSSIAVHPYSEYLDGKNAVALLEDSDVVVDCLDNVKTRFILESAAKKIEVPLVSAAVAGAFGHVITIFPEDKGLCLIYGEKDIIETKGAEASLGCLPYSVALLASLECSEVVKILLNKGSFLRNQLLVVDLMDNIFEVVHLTE